MRNVCDEDGELMHVVVNVHDVRGRVELTDISSPLQVSVIETHQRKAVAPHYHEDLTRETTSSPEVWIVMSGAADVTLFDRLGRELERLRIVAGDVLLTVAGGHKLEAEELVLVECKNGPYLDVKKAF